MSFMKLDQKLKKLEINELSIGNSIVFNYFDSIPFADRETIFLRAIYIGVLALKEDRISSFLSRTTNELGTELESLKMIFDLKQELFYKSSIKGTVAEEDVATFLSELSANRKLNDRIVLTGTTTGSMKRNKTGDIICYVEGRDDVRIVVECKFDKSLRLGAIDKKDIFSRKSDTVWSQLIEAQANRQAGIGIIVLERQLVDPTVASEVENLKYIPAVGFVIIVDSLKGDFSNLAIAYALARDMALKAPSPQIDFELFNVLVARIIRDITEVLDIRSLVAENIATNRKILEKVQKNLLSLELSREYLAKFLKDGTLSREDLLSFYQGADLTEKYKAIETQILSS